MTNQDAIRRAMFNQGAPMSAGMIHECIYQGSHVAWPPVAETQATLDSMEKAGEVKRVDAGRWGISYWLSPLEGFNR